MAQINIFPIGQIYVFKQYLDDPGLFRELADYYKRSEYRFEFPFSQLDVVTSILGKAGHDVVVVADLKEYVVCIDKFKKHAQILKKSVDNQTVKDMKVFLMKDMVAVEEALSLGAQRCEADYY